jgi:hypothetical protein
MTNGACFKRTACQDYQAALEKAEILREHFELESVEDRVSSAFADTSHGRTVHTN